MTLQELRGRLVIEDSPEPDVNQAAADILVALNQMEETGPSEYAKTVVSISAAADRIRSPDRELEVNLSQIDLRLELIVSLIDEFGEAEGLSCIGDRLNEEEIGWFWSGCLSHLDDTDGLRTLGELERVVRELQDAGHQQKEKNRFRWLRAIRRVRIAEVALDLYAAGETIEGLEVGNIPVPEPPPSWRDRHKTYKNWVIATFKLLRSKSDTNEKPIQEVVELYEKRITPKLRAQFPKRVADQAHEMVISRDTVMRYNGLKKK